MKINAIGTNNMQNVYIDSVILDFPGPENVIITGEELISYVTKILRISVTRYWNRLMSRKYPNYTVKELYNYFKE